ncbi:MAG: hypothetical protein QM790_14515 [Nibricoccus sp.]
MNKVPRSQKTWLILIGVLLVLFIARNVVLVSGGKALAGLEQRSLRPLKADSKSPTGYQWGQRSQISTPDGDHWIMQTQQMLSKGELRVRHVDYDNAPYGREVHWSSSMRWWLGGLAWIWSALTGVHEAIAVEQVALIANPLLLLIVILALLPCVWRWFGGVAAATLVAAMTTVVPFVEMFGYADPDHHGLVGACGLATVLFLAIGGGGWIKLIAASPKDAGATGAELAAARRRFVASAVAGGMGLWVSSATQVPVLLGIGFGVVAATWFGRKGVGKDYRAAPQLWRWWGAAGAATSLFFYIVEYFPSNLGMHLEVNHPLYAIAWLGAGELLFRYARWMSGDRFCEPGKDRGWAILAIAALLLLPAIIVLAGQQTFWVGDRLLWALHRDYILEFTSVFRRFGSVPVSRWLSVFNLLPVLAGLLVWLSFKSGISVVWRARLALVFAPASVVLALAIYQVRWMGTSCALWTVVLVMAVGLVATGELKQPLARKWQVAVWTLGLLVVFPWSSQLVASCVSLARGTKDYSMLTLRLSVMRDLARWLRARVGDQSAVVLSGPGASTALIYHGGLKGVGTLYWENKDGLHSMVDVFSTPKDEVAREYIQRHGVTHVIVVSWDAFAAESARLALGLRRGEEPPEDTFIARLTKGRGCPFWLRPVHYPAPEIPALKDDFILVYEVVPEQSREEAALRFGQLLLERGEASEAEGFLRTLVQHYPDYLPGWVALAQAQLNLEQTSAFQGSCARIVALRGNAASLALDDRINLATIYAVTGNQDAMRQEVRLCVDAADERNLRKLNINTLLWLVIFAQDTGEGSRRPDIMQTAINLLPPDMLKQVQAGLSGGQK